MCTSEEKGISNVATVIDGLISSTFFVSLQSCEKSMGSFTAQCKMLLFCTKTVVKVTLFELACLKRIFRLFGDFLIWFFS